MTELTDTRNTSDEFTTHRLKSGNSCRVQALLKGILRQDFNIPHMQSAEGVSDNHGINMCFFRRSSMPLQSSSAEVIILVMAGSPRKFRVPWHSCNLRHHESSPWDHLPHAVMHVHTHTPSPVPKARNCRFI
eukprot:5668252-Amphidinium_carterae.1